MHIHPFVRMLLPFVRALICRCLHGCVLCVYVRFCVRVRKSGAILDRTQHQAIYVCVSPHRMHNETELRFVSMCSQLSVGHPPNCRISSEGAANARYSEKCMLELLPDPGLRFLRAPNSLSIRFRWFAFTCILWNVCAFPCALVAVCVCVCLCLCALLLFRIASGTS